MENSTVNLLEIANKASSKNDMYKVLTSEGGMYFPRELIFSMVKKNLIKSSTGTYSNFSKPSGKIE